MSSSSALKRKQGFVLMIYVKIVSIKTMGIRNLYMLIWLIYIYSVLTYNSVFGVGIFGVSVCKLANRFLMTKATVALFAAVISARV